MSPIRLLSVAASALLLGGATDAIPTFPPAETGTGTIVVHIVDPAGRPFTGYDGTATAALYSGTHDRPYGAYAAPKRQDHGPRVYVGPVVGGVATFPNLPTGRDYEASADPHDVDFGALGVGNLRLEAGETRSVQVRVAEWGTISGSLRTPDGAPATGMSVIAIGSDGKRAGKALVDGSGSYLIRGIRSGRYRIKFNAYPLRERGVNAQYTWGFWNDGTPVAVDRESATSGPTHLSAVDGTLIVGRTLTVRYRYSKHLAKWDQPTLEVTGGSGRTLRGLSVGASGGTTDVRLPPGEYSVCFNVFRDVESDDPHTELYYYAGPGKRLVRVGDDARKIRIDGDHDASIDLGMIPDH